MTSEGAETGAAAGPRFPHPPADASADLARLRDLPFETWRLVFRAVDPVRLPPFAASAWRGGFGHALRRLCCVQRFSPCEGCVLERHCVYTTLFEARPDETVPVRGRTDRAPQPYVLDPRTPTPVDLDPGGRFELHLTLVGRARGYAAYALRALAEAAGRGIGLGRGRLELESFDRLPPAPVPWDSPPAAVEVVLETPLRLVHEGRLLGPDRFSAPVFARALVRRLILLRAFHGDGLPAVDWTGLAHACGRLRLVQADLRWREQRRHSARQGRHIRMGGLVGRFVLDCGALPGFADLLAFARPLHAGKGATLGLGRYRVVPWCSGSSGS